MITDFDLPKLLLIFIRILSVLMTGPIFSSRNVPAILKIGFAALLSLLIQPTAGKVGITLPSELFPFLLLIIQEILIGTLIGFTTNLIFAAITMGASIMSLQIGFRAANLFDPMTTAPTSALENFYTFLAIALFFAIDGHHQLIGALVRTFQIVPPGTFSLSSITIWRLVAYSNETFILALRVALPVAMAMLFTDTSLALLSKAVPQVQVFFLGLPLKMGIGFIALVFVLPVTLPYIREIISNLTANIMLISHP